MPVVEIHSDMRASGIFVQALVQSRYQLLFDVGELPPSAGSPVLCASPAEAIAVEIAIKQPSVMSALHRIVDLFASEEMPHGSRETWLSNFIETLAFWAHDAELAGAFLATCWKHERS